MDYSVIKAPIYFKIFECGKNFLKNIDATYERACMANFQVKQDTENLRYVRACMLDKKKKYYMEQSNTITTFNDNNKYLLSNAKIREAILKGMMEDEQ